MNTLNFKDYMKKYNLKNDTMNESQLQKISEYPIYPRDSRIDYDKGFGNIDDATQGGTPWCCFIIKDNKSSYFDSFGGRPDKFLIKEIPESKNITNIKDKI